MLEVREVLSSSSLAISASAVFQNPAPASGNYGGVGTSTIHWGTPVDGSQSSYMNFASTSVTAQNNQPQEMGSLVYFNGINETGTTASSVDLIVSLQGITNIRIPISISTTTNTGNSTSDADTIQISTGSLSVTTPVGQATLTLLGLSTESGPQPSLTVSEDTSRSAALVWEFNGLDGNDQISESINLRGVNGSVARTGQLDHAADIDMYRFWVPAGQRVAFDIDTPENGDPGLGSYLRLFDRDGVQLANNNDGKAPDEDTVGFDAYLEHEFVTAGVYYVAVGNWLNTDYDPVTGADQPTGTTWATGQYMLVLSDPDDQIVEAISLGALDEERTGTGQLDVSKDVDLFSFTVTAGQAVAFDVDTPEDSNAVPRLRVFNDSGRSIAGSLKANTPRESGGAQEPYLVYEFEDAGTYYVSISGRANHSFNIVTGWRDRNGRSLAGEYSLVVTPVSRTLARWPRRISGEVWMVNAVSDTLPNHRRFIRPFLTTVSGNTAPIRSGVPTWIVIHGRIGSSGDFENLGKLLEGYQSGDQVLLLDWNQGAADNTIRGLGLDGAEWIPYVARWTNSVLDDLQVTNSNRYLVGHSWGSYLAYHLASTSGGVQALVALDPAAAAVRYSWQRVNFAAVSNIAWAFYGNGLYGSRTLASTADEAFNTSYLRSDPPVFLGVGDRHSTPIHVFEYLVDNNSAVPRASYFNLSRLTSPALSASWRHNAIRGVFEGQFVVSADASGNWNQVDRFLFIRPDGLLVNV